MYRSTLTLTMTILTITVLTLFFTTISAAPLNISMGAYSPAMVVGDGSIAFQGTGGASKLVNSLEGADVTNNAGGGAGGGAAGGAGAAGDGDAAAVDPVQAQVANDDTAGDNDNNGAGGGVQGLGRNVVNTNK